MKHESTNEPVAWMSNSEARIIHWKSKHPGFGDDWIPLYTHPQDQKKDEALRLVLEALKSATPKYTKQRKDQKTLGGSLDYWKLEQHQRMKAINLIEQALENK